MSRRTARALTLGLAAGLLAVLIGTGVPTLAQADIPSAERESALWYANGLGFDELQAAGHTGEGVKIAVIDDGVNLKAAELQGANVQAVPVCNDENGNPYPTDTDNLRFAAHGTGVVAMLVGNGKAADGGLGTRGIAPKAEVTVYGISQSESDSVAATCEPRFPEALGPFAADVSVLGQAVLKALADDVDVVVLSRYERFEVSDGSWNGPLAVAARAGVPIVAGTPNPGDMFVESMALPYPLNGVVAVGGADIDGVALGGWGDGGAAGSENLAFAAPGDNLLGVVDGDSWGPGIVQGTSFATPLVGGTIALGLQAYPKATANQVLQAMIRTTDSGELHEPELGSRQLGYGYVNTQALLAVDPTQFPDENPLFVKDLADPRCGGAATLNDCAWAQRPTLETFGIAWSKIDAFNADKPQSPGENGTESPGDSGTNTVLWVLIGFGALLLLGVIATAVFVPIAVSRSRKQKQLHAYQPQVDGNGAPR